MRKRNVCLLAAAGAAFLLAAACPAQAEEWEDFLGETQSGAASGEEDSRPSAEDASSRVAGEEDRIPMKDVVDEDMVPVYGTELEDGVYTVAVDSSSSMFRIVDCQLTVEGGEMTATLTLSGDGYLKLFMGTGLEAAEAPQEEHISYVENEEGVQTYTVPVEALDMGIDCAAFSRRKEKWYDRVLVFRADSLPEEAFREGSLTTLEDLGLEDGLYQVEVSLEGGSGKVTVESPAEMEVTAGEAFATIVWSSKNYDYMIVGEEKLLPVSGEGEYSTFRVPVTVFDRKVSAAADTTALGASHEIAYSLTFESASVKKAGE